MILYLWTGYVLGGEAEPGRWMDLQRALWLHRNMDVPLIVLLALHTVPALYLAVLRRGWKRQKNKT